jgi:hypothetical protein
VISLFALFVFIKMLLIKQYYLAIVVFAYAMIQFFEFLIWLSIDWNYVYLNCYTSIILLIWLSLQPLIISLGLELKDNVIKNDELKLINYSLCGILIVSTIVYIYTRIRNYSMNSLLSRYDRKSGRLSWTIANSRIPNVLFTIMYLIVSIIAFYLANDMVTLGLFIGLFLFTLLLYGPYSFYGSMWCFFAIIIIISYFILI